MVMAWEAWREQVKKTPDGQLLGPYVDWWQFCDFGRGGPDPQGAARQLLQFVFQFPKQPAAGNPAIPRANLYRSEGAQNNFLLEMPTNVASTINEHFGLDGMEVPIPPHADSPDNANQSFANFGGDAPLLSSAPAPDAVVVGIIDDGIALGHAQFRSGTRTRFLAAWNQTAAFDSANPGVPFGRVLHQTNIDAALTRATHDLQVDETAFNAALGIANFHDTWGTRSTELAQAHGTQVADLAAGFAPDDPQGAKFPLLAVNLPNNFITGHSGNFLEFFVIQGIQWIVDQADAVWAAQVAAGRSGFTRDRGFPIVINLSYGLSAGPKDGRMLIEKYMTQLLAARDPVKAPLRFVLPAGNDNLDRTNATILLDGDTPSGNLPWRIPPEDHTSSYIEVWLPDTSDMAWNEQPAHRHLPVMIDLVPPGGLPGPLTVETVFPGMTRDLLNDRGQVIARLYCKWSHDGIINAAHGTKGRCVVVVCIAPTLNVEGGVAAAPSGLWTLRLRQFDRVTRRIAVRIQVDRPISRGSDPARQSYFDHPAYRVHDDAGRVLDTFDCAGRDQEPEATHGPVQRKGTINAIASAQGVIVVAGYRQSDRRPVPYSSTGGVDTPSPGFALPCETSPALGGILAAGSRSGSTSRIGGTSFASAQATRIVAQALFRREPSDLETLQKKAAADEARSQTCQSHPLKIGAGRMLSQPHPTRHG